MAMAQNSPLMYRYNSMEHFGDPSSKLLSLDALAISDFRTPVGLRGGVAASPQTKNQKVKHLTDFLNFRFWAISSLSPVTGHPYLRNGWKSGHILQSPTPRSSDAA